MKISGAIFDIDGTVTNSLWVWTTVTPIYLWLNGRKPEKGLYQTLKTMNAAQIGDYLKENYFANSKRTGSRIILHLGLMAVPFYIFVVPLKPGARELLEELDRQGVKMVILTANDRILVRSALIRLRCNKYFDIILGGSDYDNAKDNPKSFENACKVLGTPKEETVVFEDSLYAVRTAKSAGFPVIAMKDDNEPDPETLKQLADIYTDDFKKILDQLH